MSQASIVEALAGRYWTRVVRLRSSGVPVGGFTSDATLSCKAGYGDGRAAAFTPTAEWVDAPGARVRLTIPASMTATAQAKLYRLYLDITGDDGVVGSQIGFLRLISPPGHTPDAETDVVAYCTWDDVKKYAYWVEDLITADPAMQSDLGEQRARARSWLDEAIMRRDYNATVGGGRAGRLPSDPGYYLRTGAGGYGYYPNIETQRKLAANQLTVTDRVREMTARMAIYYATEGQMARPGGGGSGEGGATDYRSAGLYHGRMAENLLRQYAALFEDTTAANTDEYPDLVIPGW